MRNDHEIVVMYLTKQDDQPIREKGEKIRLAGTTEIISNLFWLNDYYLIFRNNESIKIIEIDERDTPNTIELTTFPNPRISWLEKQKTLLVLSEDVLYISKDVLR